MAAVKNKLQWRGLNPVVWKKQVTNLHAVQHGQTAGRDEFLYEK